MAGGRAGERDLVLERREWELMRTMEWARRYMKVPRVGTSIKILRVVVPVNGWFKEREVPKYRDELLDQDLVEHEIQEKHP